MNSPAVFRATVHSLRQVPSRKLVQIVLEAPIEQTSSIAALCEHGSWVAVAKLNPEAAAPATSGQEREVSVPPAPLQPSDKPERQRWDSLSYAQQAGIRAGDPIFRAFLEENFSGIYNSEEAAAEFIRSYCGVKSRSLLSSNNPISLAGPRWAQLDRTFLAWKECDRIVDA